MHTPRREYVLSRESFLDLITMLSVTYFCMSTELRFILQLKEEESWNVQEKETESEYWHSKSLELACVFLPSECPLLNHILLSYQKNHSPIQYTIPEGNDYEDSLRVIKPMKGIQA